jgi:LPS-assembly lipoprotein
MVARRRLLLAGSGALVAGCGFQLRRAPEMRFRTIALSGFAAHSSLAEEMRRQIDSSPTTKVVDTVGRAEVVLEALLDTRQSIVVASTAAGQVREVQLRTRLQFRLRTQAGRELIPLTDILLARDMSFSEEVALAKEQEQALIYRALESDIVGQVMRRLAAVQGI